MSYHCYFLAQVCFLGAEAEGGKGGGDLGASPGNQEGREGQDRGEI